MHTTFNSLSLCATVCTFIIIACSTPELTNPNHPGEPGYVSNSSDSTNRLIAHKLPRGIELEVESSESTITEWLISPFQVYIDSIIPLGYELSVTQNSEGAFILLDTIPAWGSRIQYVSRAISEAGVSREIDTLEVEYDFQPAKLCFDNITSEHNNSINLFLIPHGDDRALLEAIELNFEEISPIVEYHDVNGSDTMGISITGVSWQSNASYEIFFISQGRPKSMFQGMLKLAGPMFRGHLRVLGDAGLQFSVTPQQEMERMEASLEDTVRVNWKFIDSYQLQTPLSTLPVSESSNGNLECDSIPISKPFDVTFGRYSFLGTTSTDTFKYFEFISPSTLLPAELEKMVYVEPKEEANLTPFYIDIFETSVSSWEAVLNESYSAEGLPTQIQNEYNLLRSAYSDLVIPMIGVSKDMVARYTSFSGVRDIPTREQWRFSGTGLSNGTGIPIVDQYYILNENCNFSNSGDNIESNYTYLQATPTNFFTDINTPAYLVDGNSPAFSPSPYGLFQMAGNVKEWIIFGADTVLTGGSFWSPILDTLLNVESMEIPHPSESPREDWGMRTVINDISNSAYIHEVNLR